MSYRKILLKVNKLSQAMRDAYDVSLKDSNVDLNFPIYTEKLKEITGNIDHFVQGRKDDPVEWERLMKDLSELIIQSERSLRADTISSSQNQLALKALEKTQKALSITASASAAAAATAIVNDDSDNDSDTDSDSDSDKVTEFTTKESATARTSFFAASSLSRTQHIAQQRRENVNFTTIHRELQSLLERNDRTLKEYKEKMERWKIACTRANITDIKTKDIISILSLASDLNTNATLLVLNDHADPEKLIAALADAKKCQLHLISLRGLPENRENILKECSVAASADTSGTAKEIVFCNKLREMMEKRIVNKTSDDTEVKNDSPESPRL